MKKLIDLYSYRLIGDSGPEFLLLKRSKKKIYASQWRMIGGKVKQDETYWQAALRELNEETGLEPVTFWTVPSINQFYEAESDTIHHIPAFAAELANDAVPTLDDEHSDWMWVSVTDISTYIHWPEQQRLFRLIHHILTDQNQQLLPQWLIPSV
ncbi:MAG: NUDIX domain-containing protein [Bacteroidota bacterium]